MTMRIVAIIYLIVVLAVGSIHLFRKNATDTRAEALLKLLLSPQTLAAMLLALSGPAVTDLLRSFSD